MLKDFSYRFAVIIVPLIVSVLSSETIEWIVAEPGESQAAACLRNNLNSLYMGNIDLEWNATTLNSVVTSVLNRTVLETANSYGMFGCCAPGLWCSDDGCFTQGFGAHFSNYGWLNHNASALPVYTCAGASSTDIVISSAVMKEGVLNVYGQNFPTSDSALTAYVFEETCTDVETCNCENCSAQGYVCPAGTLCLSQSGYPSFCFLECAGLGDESCPCEHVCKPVFGSGSSEISLCVPSSYKTYVDQCAVTPSHLMCHAPRAYQADYASLLSTNHDVITVSATAENAAAKTTVEKSDDILTGFCESDADCADGNICTADSCDTDSGLCQYTSISGCDSIDLAVRQRRTPYMYYSYYASSAAIGASQDASIEYLLQEGTESSATSHDDYPVQEIPLPWEIVYFGNAVDVAYISSNGAVALPPVRTCDGNQCFLLASTSNVICPFYTDWDPTDSSGASIVYYAQDKDTDPAIFGVKADAFHVLFTDMVRYHRSGTDGTLGLGKNSFAASIYSDGSIRLSFVKITTQFKKSDFFGLWGAFASSYEADQGTYLRYHQEVVNSADVDDQSEMLYCSLGAMACPVKTCLTPGDVLQVRWNGTTTCAALGSDYELQLTCSFAGGVAETVANFTAAASSRAHQSGAHPDANGPKFSYVECFVPEMTNFTSGSVIEVELVVRAVVVANDPPEYAVNADDVPGSKSVYATYIGKNQELARSSMTLRYYPNTTYKPEDGCGCNALPEFAGSQCDRMGVCGGNATYGDCAGAPFGSAVATACNTCAGGLTGIPPDFACDDDSGGSSISDIVSQTIILLMVICCMTFLTMSVTYSIRRMMAIRALRDDLDRFNQQLVAAEGDIMRRQGMGARGRGLSTFECEALGEVTFTKEFYEKHKREQAELLHGKDAAVDKPEPAVAGDIGSPASTGENADACECTICLSEIEEGTPCRALPAPCGHIFHVACIDQWFQQSFLCPLCKRSIRAILLGNDNEIAFRERDNDLVQDIILLRPNFALRISPTRGPMITRNYTQETLSGAPVPAGTRFVDPESGMELTPVRFARQPSTRAAAQAPAGRTFTPSRAAVVGAGVGTAAGGAAMTVSAESDARNASPTNRAHIRYQDLTNSGDSATSDTHHV